MHKSHMQDLGKTLPIYQNTTLMAQGSFVVVILKLEWKVSHISKKNLEVMGDLGL